MYCFLLLFICAQTVGRPSGQPWWPARKGTRCSLSHSACAYIVDTSVCDQWPLIAAFIQIQAGREDNSVVYVTRGSNSITTARLPRWAKTLPHAGQPARDLFYWQRKRSTGLQNTFRKGVLGWGARTRRLPGVAATCPKPAPDRPDHTGRGHRGARAALV